MSVPRYDSYRDSGVDWLGEVPSHWAATQVRRLFKIEKRIAGELGYDVLSITQRGIKVRDVDSNDGQLSMDYAKYQLVYPGDFAMNHMDLLTGYVDLSTQIGVTSPDYRVFKPIGSQSISSRYYLYIFQMCYLNRIFYPLGQGASLFGRWRLPTEAFNEFGLPFPPPSEQVAIATFLDRETAKIDALVEEQRRLIALLAEKRQAVISHAVTKGLDPAVPMKDSGVEWLGEVPAHWEIKRLKQVVRPESAITYGIVQAGPHVEGGVPYIKTGDMAGEEFPKDGYALTSVEISESYRRSQMEKGDLVVAIRATVGKCLPLPDELVGANLTQGTAKVSPGAGIVRDFLLMVMQSGALQNYFEYFSKGATFKEITLDVLRRAPVPLPPINEQIEVVSWLSGELKCLLNLRADSEASIALLQERRAALISAAVTGKIDVRGLVPAVEEAA